MKILHLPLFPAVWRLLSNRLNKFKPIRGSSLSSGFVNRLDLALKAGLRQKRLDNFNNKILTLAL
jgi:hypothetical protein